MTKSPSVSLIERDITTYAVTASGTTLGMIGFATKGPVGKATKVGSLKDFREKFGGPTSLGFSYLAAARAFNQTNNMIFYRVADPTLLQQAVSTIDASTSGSDAYTVINKTTDFLASEEGASGSWLASSQYDFKIGTDTIYVKSPVKSRWSLNNIAEQIQSQVVATSGFQTFTGPLGVVTSGTFDFKIALNGGSATAKTISLVAGDTLGIIASKLQISIGSGAVVTVDEYTGKLTVTSTATGASSAVSLTVDTDAANADFLAVVGGVDAAVPGHAALSAVVYRTPDKKIKIVTPSVVSAGTTKDLLVAMGGVTPTAAVASVSKNIIKFVSVESGSATALYSVEKLSATNSATGVVSHTIKVYYDNVLKETFSDVSLDTTKSNYFKTVINNDVVNGGSALVKVESVKLSGTEVSTGSVVFANGMYNFSVSGSADGIPSDGGASLFVTALSNSSQMADVDAVDYHILITPDTNEEAVQNAAITLAEGRKDFLYLVDPPFGLSAAEAKEWHNGTSEYSSGRGTAVASSYAAVYWPWLKDYDVVNKKYVWAPPSVFIAEKLLETDRVYHPWYAPAGDARGKIVANDIEVSPTFAEREELYGDYNCVNPIVNFNVKGLTIYGQKTALREDKVTKRVNVRRMVIYIKKLIKRALDGMMFEPHSPDSWARAESLVNAILEPVKMTSGISAYSVSFNDPQINTADLVDQGVMKGVIKIIPVNSIEVIDVYLELYKTGAVLS